MKAAPNKPPPPSKASSPEKAEATHKQVSPGKEPKVDTTRKNGTSVEKRAGKAKKHDEAPPKSSSPGRGSSTSTANQTTLDQKVRQQLFTFCREGQTPKLLLALKANAACLLPGQGMGAGQFGHFVDTQDRNGSTLLMAACEHVQLAVVAFLLQHGASINMCNRQGNTALHLAMLHDTEGSIGELLIEKGADDTIENMYGLSPFDGIEPAQENDHEGTNTEEGLVAVPKYENLRGLPSYIDVSQPQQYR